MARHTNRRTRPKPPLHPETYAPAPATVPQDAVWDGVEADAGTDLDSHVPGWTVRESLLTGVDLAGRVLARLRCRDTRFVRCDLSGAVLDGAELERVEFVDCRLSGTVLSGAQLTDVRVTECAADMIDLRRTRGYRLLVEDSQLRAADLSGIRLTDGAVLRSNLADSILYEANLGRARLHGSDLSDIRDARALRGCSIGVEQQDAVGALLLDALDITVTDKDAG